MVYGQIAVPAGKHLMCLSRYQRVGEVIQCCDGYWILEEALTDQPIAGGFHCGNECYWWIAGKVSIVTDYAKTKMLAIA